jgi:hypothetical protein
MNLKNTLAAISALTLALCCVSCEKKEEVVASLPEMTEKGVSELISPAADSEEYSLGEYYFSPNGTKLYCGDDTISTDILLALEEYFLSFQNNDFESYKASMFASYAERYEKYLREVYSKSEGIDSDYSLKNSFELRYNNLRDNLIDTLTYESTEEKKFSGDYTITRIRAEQPIYNEGMTEESMIKSFFDGYSEIFGTDYYAEISAEVDKLVPITFFVMVTAEDGTEHKLISEANIILAEKDGKYYTFG